MRQEDIVQKSHEVAPDSTSISCGKSLEGKLPPVNPKVAVKSRKLNLICNQLLVSFPATGEEENIAEITVGGV